MIKTRIIKVKSIENEEIMAIPMTKTIITLLIMTAIVKIMMIVIIKTDNLIKI